MESSEFSTHKINSPRNRDDFTSSFLIWVTFVSLSCLISLTRVSSTMLNGNGESQVCCTVLDFETKAFRFSLLSIMLGLVFLYMTLIILRYFSSLPTFVSM